MDKNELNRYYNIQSLECAVCHHKVTRKELRQSNGRHIPKVID